MCLKSLFLPTIRELQENLIRSHCVGLGRPLSPEHTRKLLALRINILSKGFSGISVQNLEKLIAAFNGEFTITTFFF